MTEPEPSQILLTRRRLVQAGGAAGAVLYLGALGGTAAAAGVPPYLTRSSYAGLVGSTFDAGSVTLLLTEVADLERAREDASFAGRDDAFALTFSGPAGAVLDGGIHELRHPVLGSFSLFISPVDRTTGEQRYEVVVDRSVRLASAVDEAPQPAPLPKAPSGSPAAATVTLRPATSVPAGRHDPKHKPKKVKVPVKLVESSSVQRRAGVLAAEIRVAPHHGIVSVRAVVERGEQVLASATRLLRGRVGVRMTLRETHRVAPGAYVLRVTLTDRHGHRHTTARPITIR